MASLKSDCRKFAPNIFNKTKCQNCFRGKDVHSAEALESNRATRKMCLCGYLFVAPDWDFSLPANRNKRWQRRWFVLYDDGELAYSVDECPETVPQAVIDMNCVLEVTDAEDVTGNQFALAITLPEKVHFIKGTNKEETKKWFEILSRFPRNTVCGKYKRNATFPGIKTPTAQKTENNFTDWVNRRETVQVVDYSKSNGYVNSLNRSAKNHTSSVLYDPDDDVIPTKDISFVKNCTNQSEQQHNEKNGHIENKSSLQYKILRKDTYDLMSSSSPRSKTRSISPPGDLGKRDYISPEDSFPRNAVRNSAKERLFSKTDITDRYLKQELKDVKKLHTRSDITPMIPALEKHNSQESWKKVAVDIENLEYSGKNYHNNPVYVLMSDVPFSKRYDSFVKTEKTHPLRRLSSFGKKSDLAQHVSSWAEEDQTDDASLNRTIHKSASVPNTIILTEDKKRLPLSSSYSRSLFNEDLSKERLASKLRKECSEKTVFDNVRGDPDGCNLDSLPSCCTPNSDVSADANTETLSLKKGWLVKQEQNKWNKHWFVLRNSALTFFTDPIAEDAGILDGVVDLRKVQSVSEVQSSSGHTFCILMKDDTKLFLSAVTAKMRNNWIRAILQAAKLKENGNCHVTRKKLESSSVVSSLKDPNDSSVNRNSLTPSEDSERNILSKQVTKNTLCNDTGHHNTVALPPSPPLARTVISKVKERARTRSHSKTRNSRIGSTEIHELDRNYLGDSDDGTTDHSSSSLSTTPVSLLKEKSPPPKETVAKSAKEKIPRSERRSSLKLSSGDSLTPQDKRKRVFEIKDKLEDSSWTIWLDISKFCKEVEAKLDDFEKHGGRSNGQHVDSYHGEQKKEISHLISCLMKVEKRIHKVHNELEKAKVDLLLTSKDNELEPDISKSVISLSSLKDLTSISGSPSQNVLLAQQLSRAKEENRRLKQDLKTAQTTSDNFELNCISLSQELKQKQELHQSQMDLMVARVDDLTTKLLNSEKNVRQLRQRVMKLEQRQERRRSSLKGKEGLTLSKEYESKLSELEQKIDAVESALKTSEELSANGNNGVSDKDMAGKETPSLLMRLHNLDKKVKDVTEIVEQCSPETPTQTEDFLKPKIRLQVKLEENASNQDTNEDWNCLSLSTSMTDLTNPDETLKEGNEIALSFHDCLENLNYKITSVVSWLKTTLQLMHAEKSRNMEDNPTERYDGSSQEIGHLIEAIEHTSTAIDESSIISKGVNDITEKLLYKIVLLQEVASIIFKMSNFEKYKVAILIQHLTRVKRAVGDIELYISQKTNSISSSGSKTSLCNIVANLLFYRISFPVQHSADDIEKLYTEVEKDKKRVSSTIFIFKEKFIENFCSTILELSENSLGDRLCSSSTLEKQPELRPVGQKQFLSHINHIITQVSNAFVAHISKSVNELYFICSDVQYSSKWVTYICKLLQQELIRLSSEIKTVCIKQLGYDFYSGSKCGVLVEYMHCSIWELAQIVSINSVAEGTMVLIKEAMNHKREDGENKSLAMCDNRNYLTQGNLEDLNAFHQSLLHRVTSVMSNLSTYPYCNIPWNFCNSSEVSVAHRSVSSLLCFKQKWKSAIESERLNYKIQVEQLNQKLSCLHDELKRREIEGCQSCIELRQEVSYLQGELDESRALARLGNTCEKCNNLKLEIQKLMEQHERDTFVIQKLEEQETKWKLETDTIMKEKDEFFKEEKEKFEKELKEAQKQLKMMENQYNEDLRNLQSLYEQKLSEPQNDVMKSRYNLEIDQLKSLCEKGLDAMEASHQKVIAELEQRHQKELEDLMMERERVLEEEAHATAIALEAVRKAHKEELQKQIKVFKDDFMQKMSARFETEAFKKSYESEMSKIKQEILCIAEKYSVKCLENITLQENLESVTEQLNATCSQMNELRARNKRLQAQLVSESSQKLEELV